MIRNDNPLALRMLRSVGVMVEEAFIEGFLMKIALLRAIRAPKVFFFGCRMMFLFVLIFFKAGGVRIHPT